MTRNRLVPLACLLLLLAACGGGSGTGAAQPATPMAAIVFPPMNALTTADTLTVRGTAEQPGGTVSEVRVNGILATSSDGFATWQAVVNLALGANTLTTSVTGAGGASNASADTVQVQREGPLLEKAEAVDTDTNGDLLVWDNVVGLVRVSPDGARQLVSGDGVGSGPQVSSAQDVAFDPTTNTAYVLSSFWLYAIDLATGDRTLVPLSGTTFGTSEAMDVDPTGTFAIVAERGGDVYRVELATGSTALLSAETTTVSFPDGLQIVNGVALLHTRQIIEAISVTTGARAVFSRSSGTQIGSGPDFANFWYDVIVDPTDANRLLVLAGDAILTVDPSANRTLLSGDGEGSGPDLDNARALAPAPGGVYVLLRGGVIFVDTANGNRTAMPGGRIGSGPLPISSGDVAVDPASGALLLTEDGQGPVYAVDPTSGFRAEIAGTEQVQRIAFDATNGQAYVLMSSEIHELDRATGAMREISGATVGTGLAFNFPDDLSPGPQPGTLVVNDATLGVVLVDIATGARTVITAEGDFTDFSEPYGAAADPSTGMAYVVSNGIDGVFEVDGTTGDHDEYELFTQFGLELNDGVHQSWDGNLYVAAESEGEILRFTPQTGAASIVSSATVGGGPILGGMYSLDAAPHTGVAYVFDFDYKLVAIDLATGQRVVVGR